MQIKRKLLLRGRNNFQMPAVRPAFVSTIKNEMWMSKFRVSTDFYKNIFDQISGWELRVEIYNVIFFIYQ